MKNYLKFISSLLRKLGYIEPYERKCPKCRYGGRWACGHKVKYLEATDEIEIICYRCGHDWLCEPFEIYDATGE